MKERIQHISVDIVLKEDQQPYELKEDKGSHTYEALKHFFEDIGYTVRAIESR
jgi:hypothetical protein